MPIVNPAAPPAKSPARSDRVETDRLPDFSRVDVRSAIAEGNELLKEIKSWHKTLEKASAPRPVAERRKPESGGVPIRRNSKRADLVARRGDLKKKTSSELDLRTDMESLKKEVKSLSKKIARKSERKQSKKDKEGKGDQLKDNETGKLQVPAAIKNQLISTHSHEPEPLKSKLTVAMLQDLIIKRPLAVQSGPRIVISPKPLLTKVSNVHFATYEHKPAAAVPDNEKSLPHNQVAMKMVHVSKENAAVATDAIPVSTTGCQTSPPPRVFNIFAQTEEVTVRTRRTMVSVAVQSSPEVKTPCSDLEVQTEIAVKLEDFAAFHNLPGDLKKKQIESFRFANSVFPFYIPAEHHDINLSELQNSKGEYWGTAAHFLLCNKAHGIPLWKTFEAQIQSSDTAITCRPHISTNMTNRILQHIPSIEDREDIVLKFLFRNWVLLQLPFQPILLFQWLTYAVYLLSNIDMRMSKLYYVPFPEKFKPQLLCFHKMLKTAHRNIGFLFDYLQHQTRCPHLKIFGDSNEELVRNRDTEVNLQDRNLYTNIILESFYEPDDIKKVKIKSMLLDDDFLTIQRKINRLSDISESIRIEKVDSGIIGSVLENNNTVEYGLLISKLHAWIFKNYKVLPKRGPDFTKTVAAENIIHVFKELDRINYSLLTVLIGIKQKNQFSNQELECSSRFEFRIRTIVLDCIESHLRVKNFEEKKNEVLRDWHVVQYLLPCFVALYVKICESNDPEHKNLQNWYAQFLDKLICTYEEDGIRKSSWSNVLQDINSFPPLRESCLNNNHEDLSNFFTEVSNHFVERIMRGASKDARNHLHCCRFFRAFFEVIQKKTGDLEENDVVATEASAYWNWLMWDFFSRMKHALEVAE
ncbi:Hypothetical predicted protein [Cloeon dipterum]|uniref:Uncharacterized protein n=1 Tax=Cloeon dipterum TaxID=197152 RepID=A0A8S1D3F4_9INSE|nr:Hypothetical predicted protein [Cloeon dipterum]